MQMALRRLFGIGLGLSAGLLAIFHLQLLWDRLVDLANLEIGAAIRWLATAAILGVVACLWKRGVSIFRGRPALVLWILVLLVHIQTPFGGPLAASSSTEGSPADDLLLVLPVSVSLAVVGRILFSSAQRSGTADRLRLRESAFKLLNPLPAIRPRAGFFTSLSPRAPPL